MRSKTGFGNKILLLRKEQNLTQGDLASKVGVSRAAISQFELGDTLPSYETQKKLSDALGFNLLEMHENELLEKRLNDEYTELEFWSIELYPFITSIANGESEGTMPAIPYESSVSVMMLKGVDYAQALVIEVKGNTMAPRYPHESRYVADLVHVNDDEVLRLARGPHLFVLKGREPFIRRIISTTRGIVTLKADANGEEMEFTFSDLANRWLMGTFLLFKIGQAIHLPAED
jgi:transcriptional regulator with XRE-family HTH domain